MPFPVTDESQVEQILSVDGGVNTRGAAWNLGPNEADELLNIDTTRVGRWSRRLGVESKGGQFERPSGFTATGNVSDISKLYGIWGSKLFRSSGNGEWRHVACGTSFVSPGMHMFVDGIYANAGFADAQFRAVYCCQAVETSQVTLATHLLVVRPDGVPNTNSFTQTVSYAPLCMIYFQGRLWKANDHVNGNGSDLAWSELDDGLTYSPANELAIEDGIGGKIQALYAPRDTTPRIYIFKERAVAYLEPKWGTDSALIPGTGDELDTLTSKLQLVNTDLGCVATRSLVPTPGYEQGEAVLLSHDGLRAIKRAEQDVIAGLGPRLTENVPRWMERLNAQAAPKAAATVFDNAYWIAMPFDGSQENNVVMRLDLRTGALALHNWSARDLKTVAVRGAVEMWAQYNIAYTQESSITGLPSLPLYHAYKLFDGDMDPGATFITYDFITRAFVWGDPRVEKKAERLLFLGTSSAGETHHMRVAYRIDFKDWTTMVTEVVFGVPGNAIVLGTTPLVWTQPETKLIQRRLGLDDIEQGTIIQFRFIGSRDTARPEIFYADVQAHHVQQMFDNER